MENVPMKSIIIHVSVILDSLDVTVKLTSMNVFLIHASLEEIVSMVFLIIYVNVPMVELVSAVGICFVWPAFAQESGNIASYRVAYEQVWYTITETTRVTQNNCNSRKNKGKNSSKNNNKSNNNSNSNIKNDSNNNSKNNSSDIQQ